MTADGQRLSLAAELTAARHILTSAGIQVHADIPKAQLPATTDHVVATVMREAVTNVLRHSAAKTCTIEVTSGAELLRLRVSNDGLPERAAVDSRAGSGLANLTARTNAVGGQLTSSQADGKFELVAEVPLATPSS